MIIDKTNIEVKKKDMIVDLDNSTITIGPLDLILDIQLIKDANERIKQAEGIRAAHKKGKHIGRPFKDVPKFEYYYDLVESKSITTNKAAAELNISRATYYRLKDKYEEMKKGY